MSNSVTGKRVLITGGGRGLGRAMALRMVEEGASVALASRTASQLESVVGEIEALGGRAVALPVDLYDPAQVSMLAGRVAESLGGLDILVNNAGGWNDVSGAIGPVLDATVEGFDAIYRLNVQSPLWLSIAASKQMIEQASGGAILNVVSVDGLHPCPGQAMYGSAKAAMVSLTGAMAYELGQHQIRVNAIAPGFVETDMTKPWISTPDQLAERASFYPLNRIGHPKDIAEAALFLCSPASEWISGVTMPVCGGQYGTSDLFRWVRAHNDVPNHMRI